MTRQIWPELNIFVLQSNTVYCGIIFENHIN
jgi:hypothetical protein